MITLDDPIWKTFFYDVSIPLKRLEQVTDGNQLEEIWLELWDELHHQGDVGIESYLAVPQLARIGAAKDLFNWNLLGICCVIEQQRHLGDNPQLPSEYGEYYNEGLQILKQFIVANINRQTDETTFRFALSTLAACAGQIKLSKAIRELDNNVLEEFLEQF